MSPEEFVEAIQDLLTENEVSFVDAIAGLELIKAGLIRDLAAYAEKMGEGEE